MTKKSEPLNQKNKKETKFFNALKDIFVGADIHGQSGFINLMRIKSRYYQDGVFPKLKEDIDKEINEFPEFREELFDKLYTFFESYFSESGSIYFRYTPVHKNIYERVYTDDRDVILFWKTHMLYYVKTDRLFNSLEIKIDNYKFFFDVSTLEHKKANEKREIIYSFREKKEDGTLVFDVIYSEKGRITKIDDILRNIKKLGIDLDEGTLEEAFKIFEKQCEVDFFINKDANKFLKEQFDIWLYQYLFSGESQWTEKRIKQLQALKNIAYKIIDFISQFEDELVKIWNKPKFVLNSNYVITLDRIADKEGGIELIKLLLRHKNIDIQENEWKALKIVDNNYARDNILISKITGEELNTKYKFLPIDTKYFKDLELEILSLFDNLDQAQDGWLIKSENYQALITILPKFRNKIQTIYIDPPFNKEENADYFYNVKYKDSTWATLLENRLNIAKDLLLETGSIFVNSDDNGNMIIRMLMDEIFGNDNFKNEIIWCYEKPGGPKDKLKNNHSNIYYYSKNKSKCITNLIYVPRKGQEEMTRREGRFETDYAGKLSPDWWVDIPSFATMMTAGERTKHNVGIDFITQQPEKLIKRIFELSTQKQDIILDFFLGSGTSTAVAHKMNRKWIGIELGEHFYNVIIPRMKKVIAYDKTGISKETDVRENYNKDRAGGFFKYYELEQYEDTLRRVKYNDSDLFNDPNKDPYNQYVFMRDVKLLNVLEVDYKSGKIKVNLENLFEDIDIAETLSNLTGKFIKKVYEDRVEFEDGTIIDIKNIDYGLIKPLIWWEK